MNDDTQGGLYTQNDSPFNYLRRDSAELFIKETIPSLKLNLVNKSTITAAVNVINLMFFLLFIRSQLLLSYIVTLRAYRA